MRGELNDAGVGNAAGEGGAGAEPWTGIAFLHVPKCGGTALRVACEAALRPREVVGGFDLCLFEGIERESLDPLLRALLIDDARYLPPTADLVAGHFALSTSTLREAYPSHRVLTVLREPRVRLLSHWLYWLSLLGAAATMPSAAEFEQVMRLGGSLADMLANPSFASQIDNVLIRMLLWPHPLLGTGFIPRKADAALLVLAERALASLDFVGLLEDPDLDDRLAAFFGQPSPA